MPNHFIACRGGACSRLISYASAALLALATSAQAQTSTIKLDAGSYNVIEDHNYTVGSVTRSGSSGAASALIAVDDVTTTPADIYSPEPAGALDPVFNAANGPNNDVYAIVPRSDGKYWIGGGFTSVGGVARNSLARVKADGTLDTSFAPTASPNSIVNAILALPDSSLLLGGAFTSYGGTSKSYLAKITAAGVLVPSFNAGGTGPNGELRGFFLQPDGKILITGWFTSYNGVARNRLARLNSDGSLDTSFAAEGTGPDNTINVALPQADGKIYIGGLFRAFNGASRHYLARLNADGSLDTTFTTPGSGLDLYVDGLALRANGQLLVGGRFTKFNGTPVQYLICLNADGTRDPSFNTDRVGPSGAVSGIAVQADNQILIGGEFTAYNGVTRKMARLFDRPGRVVSWNNGESGVRQFAISANDDGLSEPTEFATLVIATVNGASVGSPASSALTVQDRPTVYNTVGGNGQSTLVGTPFAHLLEVEALTASGTPVSGLTLTFTAPASGASATFSGANPATAVTDSNGIARIAASANAVGGAYEVIVAKPFLPLSASFSLSNIVPAPQVISISPIAGPAAGGTTVTISGSHFDNATTVHFGATDAAFTLLSSDAISATSPAAVAGMVDVTVTTAGGTSVTGAGDQFTYLPLPLIESVNPAVGITSGNTSVTIIGAHFSDASAVTFGATAALSFSVNSDSQITALSPAGAVGTVDIAVTTPGGITPASAAGHYRYANFADLWVTVDNGVDFVGGGSTVEYQIDVGNEGPSFVKGAVLADALPSTLSDATWICTTQSGAATCPTASGVGQLDVTLALPAQSSLRYTVSATVATLPETALVYGASVVAPADVVDGNTSNDTASDGPDRVGVFENGFE